MQANESSFVFNKRLEKPTCKYMYIISTYFCDERMVSSQLLICLIRKIAILKRLHRNCSYSLPCEIYRSTDGSSGVKPRDGDSLFWWTYTTCLAISRSLSISARSRINHRRSNLDKRAGGRLIFSAGVLRRSYLPLQEI